MAEHVKSVGTFQKMNLSRPILKAVERKGYRLATPIQRKCIPPIMSGKDVVAMARTGSGKSAAFLLPLIHRLKIRQPKSAIRALILEPTRELAMQTFSFAREFSKYTNLVVKLIIGGESINRDFENITSCPDILIATPGRLAHVLVEMKQKLDDVEIVVYDEADRLFEPGFKEIDQINEICRRIPDSKQTLLFSATMPQRLADFAKTGLKDPLFVRLDIEANLSETLKIAYLHCNSNDKFAILVHLLKKFVTKDQATVVFMPTKHHIEYTKSLLDQARVDSCYVYSSLDPEARKINVDRFSKKICKVMLVTDIAARGIDIPLLDVVINFNFPYKAKLFVHRVGRVARAGRPGFAISIVSHDEVPYLHALHLFLGLPLNVASGSTDESDKVLGTVPQDVLDEENDILKHWHDHNDDLKAMVKVCENAMKPYLKLREKAMNCSIKAAKDLNSKVIGVHPFFISTTDESSSRAQDLLDRIRAYKPQANIFEFKAKKEKKQGFYSNAKSDAGNDEKEFEDSKFYLGYRPHNHAKEEGLSLSKKLSNATMDLAADNEDEIKRQRHHMVWDRKKKKYVNQSQTNATKKIKTESGAYISASYQSGLFEKWKAQSRYDQRTEIKADPKRLSLKVNKGRREIRNPEEILKQRGKRERIETIIRLKASRRNRRVSSNT